MKTLNEIKELPNLMIQHIAVDGGLGVLFKAGKSFATVVWSNGGGWEHVSIVRLSVRIRRHGTKCAS